MPAVSMTVFSLCLIFKVSTGIIKPVMVFVVALHALRGVHYKSVHSDSYGLSILSITSSSIITRGRFDRSPVKLFNSLFILKTNIVNMSLCCLDRDRIGRDYGFFFDNKQNHTGAFIFETSVWNSCSL
jgi:hypothetical protein